MYGKKQVLASMLLIPLLMTGCGVADQGEGRRDNNDVRNVNYRNPDDNNNDRKLEVAEEAADKVTDLKEVKHADIIVAGNQAYVAVVLTNGNKGAVENNLKKKIAKKVRSTDKNIDNVYVSANPDFVERMQEYGKRIQNGDPIAGLFDEFTQVVQRVFPNAE
ncbi:YhcN/YlaJ family sporulation lipoprotein [Bacillus subtilis]|uniref:YhcN/YlaJ family sporulation lipoprotein n=1 Tax=Bacillus subtilis TaxID=1423 RepID=A0A8I1WCM0_BACIU|nr:YhcN/YlaJ family sporulation lipoprotein [Bacillus subtilis]MBO3793924.1 YhcN/YlaJ family sporulation lipoprotein [Bacillus subtilis]TWG81525.1 YhcN/YlaJ family sporulation lipoprotein [Bacillus subtilis J27]